MFVDIDELRNALIGLYESSRRNEDIAQINHVPKPIISAYKAESTAYKKSIELLDETIRTKNLTAINTEEMRMKKSEYCQRLLSDYLGDESLGDIDDVLLCFAEYLYERGLLKTSKRAEKAKVITMSISKK